MQTSGSGAHELFALFQDAATKKDVDYLLRILQTLDDDSEDADLMKDLIGLAESYDLHDYIQAVLDANAQLTIQAQGWLDVITYRILNSRPYCQHYVQLLREHQEKNVITAYLRCFLERNPEKRQSVEEVLHQTTESL
ncbi:Imm30 family immunity protein [Stenotrophomonas sp. SMYL11]|jgi:Immunity protein 30|uniref:Imm30 family immunity protein n=1 Tax=Stenotrophomonas sp. SMYL11 TaxID=3076042 RepID=UPI002E7A99B6|nr:Imm30 family immunity protein [Stenotrophomonas sp. SMYL11]